MQQGTRGPRGAGPGAQAGEDPSRPLPRSARLGDSLELRVARPGVAEALLLLAEDLQLQEELLLLEQPRVGRVHGRRRLLRLLVRGYVLVVFELLHLWLGVLGLFVAVLAVAQGLGLQGD